MSTILTRTTVVTSGEGSIGIDLNITAPPSYPWTYLTCDQCKVGTINSNMPDIGLQMAINAPAKLPNPWVIINNSEVYANVKTLDLPIFVGGPPAVHVSSSLLWGPAAPAPQVAGAFLCVYTTDENMAFNAGNVCP